MARVTEAHEPPYPLHVRFLRARAVMPRANRHAQLRKQRRRPYSHGPTIDSAIRDAGTEKTRRPTHEHSRELVPRGTRSSPRDGRCQKRSTHFSTRGALSGARGPLAVARGHLSAPRSPLAVDRSHL